MTSVALQRASNHVADEEFMAQYPNVKRFFFTVLNQKEALEVTKEAPSVIAKAKEFVAPAKEKKEKPAAPATAAATQPKAEKKSTPKPKAVEQEDEEDEPSAPAEPKAKHPCEALGKPVLNLEDWKRKYSNEDTPVAMKWLEENIKPDEYSFWKVQYRYNEELTQYVYFFFLCVNRCRSLTRYSSACRVFMSSNLIGGFHNRLEGSRKYLFGSACVYGTMNNSKIQGAYMCRGQGMFSFFSANHD